MDWCKCRVESFNTILEVLRIIDNSSLQIALVVDHDDRLLGTVTDGDIRRAILQGINLEQEVSSIMNTSPITVNEGTDRYSILRMMQERTLNQIPIVGGGGVVVDLISFKELAYQQRYENIVVLMVGGLGTRLRPLTSTCPKPLLKVGNKPILETIIENFIERGFYKFYLAVNYKAEMIKEYFGDGSRFGVTIKYINEKECLGTAGALGLLPEKPKLPIIVMNGDLLTKVNFEHLLKYHEEQQAVATMAVRDYKYQVPYGVLEIQDDKISAIKEKPIYSFFVNAGIYVLNPEMINKIKTNECLDMPDLLNGLVVECKSVAAFPIREYWLDIGRIDDFEKAQGDFVSIFK